MKLKFNILGVEIWSLQLDQLHETADAVEQAVEPVARLGERALTKVMQSKTAGRVIGRISTAWVATGMQR